jgi:hypothetical protein
LGIKPEDVARIEQLILAEGESRDQEEAPAIQSRQQDLQVQRASEETAQAREREQREAQRDREDLRVAQAEAQRQQEAARAQQPERQKQRDKEDNNTLHYDSQPILAQNPSPVLKPVALPPELVAAIESPFLWQREGAMLELNRLLKSNNAGLALSARAALERLKDDDSHRIRTAVAQTLAAYTESQPRKEGQANAERKEQVTASINAPHKVSESRLVQETIERNTERAGLKAEVTMLQRYDPEFAKAVTGEYPPFWQFLKLRDQEKVNTRNERANQSEVISSRIPEQTQGTTSKFGRDTLLAILRRYEGRGQYYIGAALSTTVQATVRQTLNNIPENEEVLAFIDTTFWNTLGAGLAFTTKRIAWRNALLCVPSGTSKSGQLLYSVFPVTNFTASAAYEILLGNGLGFNCAGSGLSNQQILELLNNIRSNRIKVRKPP